MDEVHSLSTLMVVLSLDVNKDSHQTQEKDEILGYELPYLREIGALMYLVNTTRPDITFVVNLLARYSSTPTRRHLNRSSTFCDILKGHLI